MDAVDVLALPLRIRASRSGCDRWSRSLLRALYGAAPVGDGVPDQWDGRRRHRADHVSTARV